MNKNTIIKEMKVNPIIDPSFEINRRIQFIKKQLINSKLTTLVLGISGGVDSSVTGRLAQLAVSELNSESLDNKVIYRFVPVRLPFAVQADEDDAQLALNFIDADKSLMINIQSATDSIHCETINSIHNSNLLNASEYQMDFAKGNVKARMRMIVQYEVAGILNGLVLGTDHSAENVTGFFTKNGDGACDLAPLFGLNKRQVRLLAKELGAPEVLIGKTPTADLESLNESLSDEEALGVSYDLIDDFLEGKEVSKEIEDKIIGIYLSTTHKRDPIPTIYDSDVS